MSDVASGTRDRAIGALVGLAVGDAVGTTLEFEPPGSFTPITDMVGGGVAPNFGRPVWHPMGTNWAD